MKILVTGAGGFIGSNLMKCFAEHNDSVTGWDIEAANKGGLVVEQVNLDDEEILQLKLQELQPEIIIHCAGCADVGRSVQNPAKDFQGNVTLTHRLLFAIHRLGMDQVRFVFLSSAAVYGNPKSLPITEQAALNPLSPYALHKVMCEDICQYFANNYGMDIRIARIFSAYGKGLCKQIFWDMYNKTLMTGRLELFGTGEESRDYIHIDDVVEALYLIATSVKASEQIYNVANGEEVTIRAVAEFFADCSGLSRNAIKFNNCLREGDPRNWCADISRIKALGYQKKVQMSAGIWNYIEWAKNL